MELLEKVLGNNNTEAIEALGKAGGKR